MYTFLSEVYPYLTARVYSVRTFLAMLKCQFSLEFHQFKIKTKNNIQFNKAMFYVRPNCCDLLFVSLVSIALVSIALVYIALVSFSRQ